MSRIKPYFENKYLISPAQTCELSQLFAKFCSNDKHGDSGNYEILSLYYDTPDLDFFYDKIHGEYSKTKVRIRFYRNRLTQNWHDASIEIKQRNGNEVTKQRSRLAQDFSPHLCFESRDFDIKKNILQTISDVKTLRSLAGKCIKPAAIVFYKRHAMQFEGIEGLRLTFDSEIAGLRPTLPAFFQDIELSSHSAAARFGNVFEIKAYTTTPAAILQQLEKREIHQQSFSKYAVTLQRLMERTNDARLVI